MPIKHITSRDNPEYRALLELAGSASHRRDVGMTLLDGPHLLSEALAAGQVPARLVFADDCVEPSGWLERLPQVPAIQLPRPLFAKLSPVATPSGLMAVLPVPAVIPGGDRCVLLLEAIQDPGNLGAILRTAAATGVSDVYLSPGCAEAWSPKALRGGQGGQFKLAVHEAVDLPAWVAQWPGPVLAAMPQAQRSLYQVAMEAPVAFAFGNEGAGLSPALAQGCTPFSIPMEGGVESLNVAVSVAVCLYERLRRHMADTP